MNIYKLFISCLILLYACNTNKLPEGILTEQQMINITTDLQVVDGYVSSLLYQDTLSISARDAYASVYKKHDISKGVYDKSLKYYSKQPVLLDSMYSKVEKKLQTYEKRATKNEEAQQKKLKKNK